MDERAERQTDMKKRVVALLHFVVSPKKKPIIYFIKYQTYTLQSLVFSLCTGRLTPETIHVSHTIYLCVLHDCNNKQHLFQYTTILNRSVEITNNMQPCNRIYYSNFLLKAQYVLSGKPLIIRSSKCICSLWFTYVCGD
jgi:hypothetical protein